MSARTLWSTLLMPPVKRKSSVLCATIWSNSPKVISTFVAFLKPTLAWFRVMRTNANTYEKPQEFSDPSLRARR